MMPTRTVLPTRAMPAEDLEAAADLQRAEAQRGRGAEEGGEDRQDVDDLAASAVRARSPISGVNAALISCRRPLRKAP